MCLKVVLPILILLMLSPLCSAEKLIVAFGNTLAPWVMAESNEGILIDLITEAMEPLGYEIETVYYPYARRINSYQSKRVDVVCDINQSNINNFNLTGYFSGTVYSYRNYIFSLKKRNYQFSTINELNGYSVLAWQGARKELGSHYALMASSNPFYIETHDQRQQVKMLFKERVDIIQLDKQIFEFYRASLITEKEIDENITVDSFSLFKKSPNGFLFRHSKARDDFVKQIELMRMNGRYSAIFNKYI